MQDRHMKGNKPLIVGFSLMVSVAIVLCGFVLYTVD